MTAELFFRIELVLNECDLNERKIHFLRCLPVEGASSCMEGMSKIQLSKKH